MTARTTMTNNRNDRINLHSYHNNSLLCYLMPIFLTSDVYGSDGSQRNRVRFWRGNLRNGHHFSMRLQAFKLPSLDTGRWAPDRAIQVIRVLSLE